MSAFMFIPCLQRAAGAALVSLTVVLAACGGGGGDASGTSAAAATATIPDPSTPVAMPVDTAAVVSVSASAPAVSGFASSVATTDAGVAGVNATVGMSQALSVTLNAALVGLSDSPPVAAVLALPTPRRTFYIDAAAGADTNDGLAAATGSGARGPWRTFARLMTSDLAAGDTVRLACGGVWRETLRLPANGSASLPIVVTATEGCATQPAIDGSIVLAAESWVPYRGNIYRASLPSTPLQVYAAIGNFTQAHYPNRGDQTADPTSMYLALAADAATTQVNGNGVTVLTTGPDFKLPAGASVAPGTLMRVRTNNYTIEDATVAAFDGTRLTLAKAMQNAPSSGWGYYLYGQLWMLDSPGEWSFDPDAGQLYAWMPDSAPPPAGVAASVLAVGIDLQGRQHVVIDGLAVRKVGLGVDLRSTADVQLRNGVVSDISDLGVDAAGSTQDVIESIQVARTGADAITGWGGAMAPSLVDASGLTVRNNVVIGSGVIMQGDVPTSLPRRSLAAIFIGSNATASGNVVVDSAYIGILAQSKNQVLGNFVYGACSLLDDCGGIYTGGDYNGSVIRGNTVVHARGSLPGQPLAQRGTAAQGIYLDDASGDIVVDGNTVIDADHGIQMHNAARNTVTGNHLYGNRVSQLWMQEDTNLRTPAGDMNGNLIQGNVYTSVSPLAPAYVLSTRYADTSRFGSFDLNRYNDTASPIVAVASTASGGSLYSMHGWRGLVGVGSTQPVDVHGVATSQRGYAWYAIGGTNLIANSALASDSAGWSSWNASAPAAQMIREQCPAGMCLRYVPGGSAGILSSPGFAVQKGTWYRLSVDLATTTDQQTVPLVVRVGGADYASVTDRNLAVVASPTWQRYSVVFQATRTVDPAAASTLSARVDVDGIVPGSMVSLANLELVPITPSAAARSAGVIVNAGPNALSMTCPANLAQVSLCGQMFGLADDQPLAWPLTLAPHSSTIVYGLDTTLLDSDGDGIPDYQDACSRTLMGGAVNASGCPFGAH